MEGPTVPSDSRISREAQSAEGVGLGRSAVAIRVSVGYAL